MVQFIGKKRGGIDAKGMHCAKEMRAIKSAPHLSRSAKANSVTQPYIQMGQGAASDGTENCW